MIFVLTLVAALIAGPSLALALPATPSGKCWCYDKRGKPFKCWCAD